MNASEWKNSGQMITINGYQHFVYDSNTDKPNLLILHGYPTCSYDYYKVLPKLEQHFRVIIHDHLGFGYSDKPLNYSYSLIEQTDQALQLWATLGIKKAVVLAHDYGTSIATELLARMQRFAFIGIDIQAMILCNGSMHIEMSKLRLIQKLLLKPWLGPWVARFSNQSLFSRNIKKVYFNPAQVTDEEMDSLWVMMMHNEGRRVLSQTTQYIKQRHHYWYRWIGALKTTSLPIKIVWAENDPVAVVDMAHQLHTEIQNSELYLLENLGHFPMLENPSQWSKAVLKSLNR